MTDQQSAYRQIMKATTLFGGVQVFNIIIGIIRSKFLAVFLGPSGIGIMGLLTSTIGIISSLTNFGLGTSAVKDIATAYSTSDEKQINIVITAFRRMIWITGLLGLVLTLLLAPWLSQLTFGNKNYTLAFIWLSSALLFSQLCSGQIVLLQGMRKLKLLATVNLAGSTLGLIISLPLFFFYGIDGIVPAIIGTALVSLLISWYFSGKVKNKRIDLSSLQTIKNGKNMLRMGFIISLSSSLSVGFAYVIRVFISRTGGVEQVGLYNAGFAIINTYVGLIFTAMSTDYYPRLSSVAHDNNKCRQTINQQAEIALLILAPILIIFLIFINWVVILLYTMKFMAVNGMIYWAALGMYFKACSWSIAFIFLAKGTNKLYFWIELTANILELLLNLIGYHFWGLTGLGISFTIFYILYLGQVYLISKIKFAFTINHDLITIFIVQFGLAIISFLVTKFLKQPFNYISGIILVVLSGWYSFQELDKRLGIQSIIKNYHGKL